MDTALIEQIFNKLQGAKAVLDLLYRGKEVPKELIEIARESLDEAVRLLETKRRES